MHMLLTFVSGVLTLASSLVGLWAARLWWSASRQPVPDWVPPWTWSDRPGDPDVEVRGEVVAATAALFELSKSLREGARLNARAALWTGVSVVGLLAASVLTWVAQWLGAA